MGRKRKKAPRASTRPARDLPWAATYYLDAGGSAPAREALYDAEFPQPVRLALLARIVAVRDHPPLSFPTGTNVWRLMRDDPQKGGVDMSGIFEARDKHGSLLYRLFCVLDSNAGDHGADARLLVMLSLGVKPERTAMNSSVYRRVRGEADRYFATSPRPIMLPPTV